MNEAFVTFQGWVGTDVTLKETPRDGHVANFRVGSTPRYRKRGGDWVDGPTSWFSVSCWRTLATHVAESVKKGDAVVVHGKLRTDVWARDDGQSSTTYVVDAQYVGHDLNRGTAAFIKTQRPQLVEDDESESVVKAMIHQQVEELPQLTSEGEPRDVHGAA